MIIKPRQLNSDSLLEFKNFVCLKLINPFFLFLLSINFLSLAGIPPLSGFISKFFIFLSLVEGNFLKFMLFFIFLSLIIAYYYIRIIKILVFTNLSQVKFLSEVRYISSIILVILFNLHFVIIITPTKNLTIFLNLILNLNL